MATVTGLTAERMLAIEAASVVDGDVVGDNLILTQHGGTQINAGSVRGPQGNPGPVGQDLSVISAAPVLAVGQVGQIRAGRQLTAADFTNMGLSVPLGLWNLSDLTDASGNGRNLLNKGAVGLTKGINGLANTAARFTGSAAQVLYIPDTGASDPMRLRTGSWGCWFKSAKRGTEQVLLSKNLNATNQRTFYLEINTSNALIGGVSPDGSGFFAPAVALTDVADDRWHFASMTWDGSYLNIYVDGQLEGSSAWGSGPMFSGSAPFNIGGVGGDAATAPTAVMFGSVDEAFITADVLSHEHIRALYCAKVTHTLAATPSRVSLNVRRRRRGAALVVGDFPAPPLRLHNFSAGSLGDEGTNGVPLINITAAVPVAGVDGALSNAYSFNGSQWLNSTDTGLPVGTSSRSYGCWFKTIGNPASALQTIIGYGGGLCRIAGDGTMEYWSGAEVIVFGAGLLDGRWHHMVVTEDNAPVDGLKRRAYLDGRCAGGSVNLAVAALGGKFHLAADASNLYQFAGQIDGAFMLGAPLSGDDIAKLYNKGLQAMGPSPKSPGDHVETLSSTDILVTFDTLEPQHLVDLTVAP